MNRGNKTTRSAEKAENQDFSKEDLTAAILETLKSNEFMKKLSNLISNAVSTHIKDAIKKQNDAIKSLEQNFDSLKKENDILKFRAEKTELYLRRNNLRIIGIPETTNENTEQVIINFLHDKMSLNIDLNELESCYRMGVKREGKKHRAIVVKFLSKKTRNLVYKSKKILKGQRVLIKEDLTTNRLELYKKACEEFHPKNVWTSEGIIFVFHNKNVEKFETEETLQKLLEEKTKMRQLTPEIVEDDSA